MTITQTINTLTNPINRDTQTPAEISEAGDTTIAELQTIFGQQNTLSGQINSSITEMNGYVSSSASNAASALSSKTSAESAKDQALASSNFKGNWSDLTGSLSVPASVFHSDQFWVLASDISDVTTKIPGIDTEWINLPNQVTLFNDIGIAGSQSFGVGICSTGFLPSGMTLLPGTETLGHDNYGNYQFQDGSIVVYVPAHWIKIGTGSNGFDVNVFSVLKYSSFNDETEANAAGYFLPRPFKDGGETKLGYFVDKYQCSKNAWGTGYIASSIKDGLPVSTHADHNPIADLTACSANAYYEAITAAKARDGENGAVSADPQWFCCSRFIYVNLAMLATAHGQAATGSTHCAWYDATHNYPKGCNDNALGDTDDGTVSYTSDGYSNCGKTGSGSPFAKTTHNGQNCGVVDLNGNMYEISTGVTCIASAKSIEDISRTNPANVQITGHGYSTGAFAMILSTSEGDWESLDDKIYQITVIDTDNFTLDGVDTSGFSAAYVVGTNGGSITVGTFYAASEDAAIKDFTSGNSGATDHWGSTGVAAMMDEFTPAFDVEYPNNGFSQRMGSGANQALSEAVSGNDAILTGLGMPKDADGVDTIGTNLFGKDYFYQYIRNELCVRYGGYWGSGSGAGVWSLNLDVSRTYSYSSVGFRCACYPV